MIDVVPSSAGCIEIRVAHLLRKYAPHEWGGTETAVRDLLKGLRNNHVKSVIYAPHLENHHENTGDVFREDGFDVRRFRAFVPILGLRACDRKSLVTVGGNIMSFDAAIKLFQQQPLDVIHTHALGRLGGIARFVARTRRIPLVVTIHGGCLDLPLATAERLAAPARRGIDYGKLFGLILRTRRLIADADAVITVNPREGELLRTKFPGVRVEVVPHGLPLNRYHQDRREAAAEFWPAIRGRTFLLYVGRIDAVKNQGFVVDCMPEICRNWPNSLLVLVGPTTDEAHEIHVRRRIHELGLEHSVLLTGPLSPDDPRLVGLYQSAHVFVLPSLSETFGLVLLEAWAAGCPVIASATSGAKQLVRDGENGFTFTPNDPQSFMEALQHTFKSDERRKALGRAGQHRVEMHYDTRAVARRVRYLYAELHAKARRRNEAEYRLRGANA